MNLIDRFALLDGGQVDCKPNTYVIYYPSVTTYTVLNRLKYTIPRKILCRLAKRKYKAYVFMKIAPKNRIGSIFLQSKGVINKD